MRKFLLKDPEYEKSVILFGGRQFTIYDTYYIEEEIDIKDGYMWFIQYDNNKKISLNDFQLFMSKSSIGSFNFKETLQYFDISFSSIPQASFRL